MAFGQTGEGEALKGDETDKALTDPVKRVVSFLQLHFASPEEDHEHEHNQDEVLGSAAVDHRRIDQALAGLNLGDWSLSLLDDLAQRLRRRA